MRALATSLLLLFRLAQAQTNQPVPARDLSLEAGDQQARGAYDEAEKLYLRALAILREHPGPSNLNLAVGLTNLADFYSARARYFEAEKLCLEALDIEKRSGVQGREITATLETLGEVESFLGRNSEAIGTLRHAIELQRKLLGDGHVGLTRPLTALGNAFLALGRFDEAEALFRDAIAIQEKTQGPNHVDVARAMNRLAGLYGAQGRFRDAEKLSVRVLSLSQAAFGADDPNVAIDAAGRTSHD